MEEIGGSVGGIECERLVGLGDRFVVLLGEEMDLAETVLEPRGERGEIERTQRLAPGFVEPGEPHEVHAQLVVRLGVAGVESDGLAKRGLGARPVTVVHLEDHAEDHGGLGERRVQARARSADRLAAIPSPMIA